MTATVRAPARLGYQPALDGLRGIAVVLVLLYHGGVAWATGGFLGVDVFFVLSGFLITWLLVEEHRREGRLSIRDFYARRARRLLPALGLTLVAVVAYAATLAPEGTLRELRGDVLATIGYMMNWRLVVGDRGYFDAFAVPSPLKHTWSLAVEEQWYVVWPPVLGLLLALGRRARHSLGPALGATLLLAIGSAAWMAALAAPGEDPSRAYYGTDTRAHELLAGAVLALLLAARSGFELPSRAARVLDPVAGAGLAWVLYASATVDDRTTWIYEGGLGAVAAAVALVVLAVLQPSSRLRTALSFPPLRWVGLVSYGLYLWHFPTYVVLSSSRTGLSGTSLLLLRLTVTAALSTVSYVLVERPCREGRWPLRRVIGGASLALGSAAAALALVVAAQAPAPTPSPAAAPVPVPADASGTSTPAEVVATPPDEGGGYVYDPARNPAPEVAPGEEVLRVLATGESVSLTLSHGFVQRSGTPPTVLWDNSILGCSLFEGERTTRSVRSDGGAHCAVWRADRDRWIEEYDPDVVTVLSGVWEVYDRIVDGETLDFGSEAHDRWFTEHLEELVEQLGAGGARVVLLSAPCNDRPEDITGESPPENDLDRILHLNDLYARVAERSDGRAVLIDLFEKVCPGGELLTELDGTRLREDDGVHFAPEGAAVLRAWLYPRLAELAQLG